MDDQEMREGMGGETKEKVEKMLAQLDELRSAVDVVELEKRALIDQVLTPEIREKVAEIEAEYRGRADVVLAKCAEVENAVKTAVVELGETVSGEHLRANFCPGRVSWDTKGLDKAIALIPALSQYRKEGNPYVSIVRK
jgi:hypothetical protein